MSLPRTGAPLVRAIGLKFEFPGRCLFQALSFSLHPGLTLVCGGDGCGKTSLMRIPAGQFRPRAAQLVCHAAAIAVSAMAPDTGDQQPAGAWLQARSQRFPEANASWADQLAEALGLSDHLH